VTITANYTSGGKTFTDFHTVKIRSCTYSIKPTSNDFPAGGGYGSITITPSSPDCETPWEADTDVSWIKFTSSRFGSGAGTVGYVVAINEGASSRSGTININGVVHRVNQVPFLVKPNLIEPADGDHFYFGEEIIFSWTKVQGATRYYITIRYSGTVTSEGVNFNRDADVENSTSHTLVLHYDELVKEGIIDPGKGNFIWAVYPLNEYESKPNYMLKSEIRDFYLWHEQM
jgi:hypothetical protein